MVNSKGLISSFEAVSGMLMRKDMRGLAGIPQHGEVAGEVHE